MRPRVQAPLQDVGARTRASHGSLPGVCRRVLLSHAWTDASESERPFFLQSQQGLTNRGGFKPEDLAHDGERECLTAIAPYPIFSFRASAPTTTVLPDATFQHRHHQVLDPEVWATRLPTTEPDNIVKRSVVRWHRPIVSRRFN